MVIIINLAREVNRFWCWQWKHCSEHQTRQTSPFDAIYTLPAGTSIQSLVTASVTRFQHSVKCTDNSFGRGFQRVTTCTMPIVHMP